MWTPTESTDKRFPVLLEDESTGAPIDLFTVEAARQLAGRLLAVCDRIEGKPPNPMAAPALGMRVWIETVAVTSGTTYTTSIDVREILPGSGPMRWDAIVRDPDTITIITDFRTGEVLWRRS